MNYGSGLMLGMGLAQAAKGFLSGGMGGGKGGFNAMGGFADVFGGSGQGGGKRGGRSSGNFFDSVPHNMPQAAPAAFNAYEAKSEEKSFELVSALPGRRRYRASYISKELAEVMEEKLSNLDYITSVEVNPNTGSVLFTFDEKDLAKIDELAHTIKKRLFSANYAEYKRDKKLNQIFYGSVTKSIKSTLRQISHTIIRETGGLFDIRSLTSMILTILGFRKVILNGEFPSGIQMLWWAVSLMRGIKIA